MVMIKMLKIWTKKRLIILLVCLVVVLSAFLIYHQKVKKIELHLGIYSGSSWGVPNGNDYQVIDQVIAEFEKKHPNVTVTYESGISKDDYSTWLSDAIINGEQPDIFILPENDFNLLASTGSLKKLDSFIQSDLKVSDFYNSAYQAGHYGNVQYALPYESNPTMMCINKDLLEKEGITIPSSGWTLAEFYDICQQVTKDTNGDGILDQYGLTGYTWQQALAAYGVQLFDEYGTKTYLNTEKVKSALGVWSKLNALTGNYQVSTEDFDEGRVAFLPMTLAQYRTYKPYPYHVAKYSSFAWTCVQMPAAKSSINATQVSTSLYGISVKTQNAKLSWEFLKLLTDNEATQQMLFETSQGTSVLKKIMKNTETKDILKNDDFGSTALSADTLDSMMTNANIQPKFKKYNSVLEKVDYLITQSLKNKTIDSDLADIQHQIEDQLK